MGPGTAQLQARLEFIKPTPLLSVGSWPILQGVVSTKGSGVLLVEACDSAVRPCGCGPEGSSYSLQRIGPTLPEGKGNRAIIEGIFQEEVSHTGLAGCMMERFLD